MKLFGLTGGIGTGKSTASGLLERRGIPVIDTDVLARDLVEPGQSTLAEVVLAFGRELLDDQGRLRRRALAEIVFSSPDKLKQLEAILHPRIRERWLAQAEQWRRDGRESAVVVIPLLFETNAQPHFDAVVCTACSAVTQHARLQGRGWSDSQIQQRLAAQWPLEKKMAASNYVIWTEGDVMVHEQQLAKIFAGTAWKTARISRL
jgi:dephospho-CoA kinase